MKKKTKTSLAVTLPRMDVSDAQIVAAVKDCLGLPTRVADKFSMSLSDLLVRAKASADISGAFVEMRQRTVDLARAKALSIAMGDADTHTPPDPEMLRWYIKRYEQC